MPQPNRSATLFNSSERATEDGRGKFECSALTAPGLRQCAAWEDIAVGVARLDAPDQYACICVRPAIEESRAAEFPAPELFVRLLPDCPGRDDFPEPLIEQGVVIICRGEAIYAMDLLADQKDCRFQQVFSSKGRWTFVGGLHKYGQSLVVLAQDKDKERKPRIVCLKPAIDGDGVLEIREAPWANAEPILSDPAAWDGPVLRLSHMLVNRTTCLVLGNGTALVARSESEENGEAARWSWQPVPPPEPGADWQVIPERVHPLGGSDTSMFLARCQRGEGAEGLADYRLGVPSAGGPYWARWACGEAGDLHWCNGTLYLLQHQNVHTHIRTLNRFGSTGATVAIVDIGKVLHVVETGQHIVVAVDQYGMLKAQFFGRHGTFLHMANLGRGELLFPPIGMGNRVLCIWQELPAAPAGPMPSVCAQWIRVIERRSTDQGPVGD